MKIHIIVILLLISSIRTFAQKELPDFGKIDKADLAPSECESDKDAVAYKLVDYGDVRYARGNDLFSIL
ncbi:MAG: hypothetical protein ABI863_17985 [Ginsengibacter sp.]